MQLIRQFAVASFIMLSVAACAEEETSSEEIELFDPKTSTVESELAACTFDGGCTSWDSTNGCTQLTCCTVCGDSYRCSEQGTVLGIDTCVFFPRRF